MMWDKWVVENVVDGVGDFMMACSFKNNGDGFQWAFAIVYEPNID